MRQRAVLPALMISLLLAGCGSGAAAEERLEQRRDALAAAEFQFTAEARSFLGDEAFDCTLAVRSAPGETVAEILAPEAVSGIRAVSGGGTELRYESVSLTLGDAAEEFDGPLPLLPRLCAALREGHILQAWAETREDTPLLAAEYYVDDSRDLTVWYGADTLAPVHAEFRNGQQEILRCEILNFTEGTDNGDAQTTHLGGDSPGKPGP